ncbi:MULTISPECIES: type I restriction-modification system subunit M [Alistipes]|uniref:type I restriction-modification system subunit M n=1 Tax=Alistipes TaxID=239759 RepID=UPI001B3582F0|nr:MULTISPECIES: class I SAM-dependent DNA methyltransferase [Alistipes]MBQ4903162.1 SAM-dependent DNA methyltransferase [Alistipes sp. Marseille-P2263]MCI2258916.1 type I restriction-modification system subunit M [Alistipes dispar]
MTQIQHNQLVSFIWNIANDVLVNVYNKGDYRKVILPMIVLRRFDAVLEDTKKEVLAMKERLTAANIIQQDEALCAVAGQAFCNSSPFTLKDLKSRTNSQQLKLDFIAYLDGFSANVQDIITKFKFRNEIDTLVEGGVLGLLIEKFVDNRINLSNRPVIFDDGSVRLPALDNHSIGTVFEELLRRFNEENNVTEAGEHFTPRDIVTLMAEIAFVPIMDKITDNSYLIYDGACGTGGILSVSEERFQQLAEARGKRINTHIFGQELQPETYATCKSDLLIKGDGEEANNISFGSTISEDGKAGMKFDFCISNPPFGTPWKRDLENWGLKDKKDITDGRFLIAYDGNPAYSLVPNIGDPQMLFLANNISRMKDTTELGTRIVEVHNGSSLFTGNAGGGESNLRRYIIENDLLEAIIAVPEKMFYNTGIGTFIWIVTNRKESRRKGKIQLIDATGLKSPLRKNLGEKNCEFTPEINEQILRAYMDFEETPISKIFDNSEFGYWEITVDRPKRDEQGVIVKNKRGKIEIDKTLRDKEQVPLTYEGGIEAFVRNEILPYTPDAIVNTDNYVIGYELSFTKYFYKPKQLRTLDEIRADIRAIEESTKGLLDNILNE